MQTSKIPTWVKLALGIQAALILVLFGFTFELRLKPVGMSYQDWVAILLTGIAVLMSVLGLFLAVLAFVGWQTFDRRVAQRVADNLREGFQEGGYLRTFLAENLEEGFATQGYLRKHLQEAVEAASYDIAGGNDAGSSNDEANE